MQPIVPKGYDINQFPPALDASQLAVREATATLSKSAESVDSTEKLILAQISKYSQFFTAHFGLNPLNPDPASQSIMALYFPAGHSVKQGGGTGNTLSIAQEIMMYTNPSPADYGLKIEVLIAILNGILRIPKQENKDTALVAQRIAFVEEAIFKLDKRPTRDAIIAGRDLPQFNNMGQGGYQRKLSKHMNSNRFKKGINQQTGQGGTWKFGYANPVPANRNVWLERPHAEGFSVIGQPIVDYYQQAYNGTAMQFWQYTSKHRLGVEVDPAFGKDNYTVKVFSVDPMTGAPKRIGQKAVARAPISQYQGNSGFLLANVKKNLFPEMYLLSERVTSNTADREEHYKDQLLNAKNMFEGIPDKAKTPIVTIIEQSYAYQYIKDTQDWSKGTEPKSPGSNTSIPINAMRVYLQPTGIETAMRRILDISHSSGNAIQKWTVTDLLQNVANKTGDYPFIKYTTSQVQWNALMTRYGKTIEIVYALLDSPHVYSSGLSNTALTMTLNSPSGMSARVKMWGRGSPIIEYPTPLYSQYLSDALKIFRYAGWPEAAPTEIFSAPVDDEQDLSMLLGMFNRYMNENATIAPGQMYVPESFNGTIQSRQTTTGANAQSTEQAGIPNYEFKFVPRITTIYKKSKQTRWFEAKAPKPHMVIKQQRYYNRATTAVSRRVVGGTTSFNMPVVRESFSSPQERLAATTVPLGQVGVAKYIGGGVVGIAALMAGYNFVRRT